jgi:hypothetical protein
MLNQISSIHEKIRFSALGVLKDILAVARRLFTILDGVSLVEAGIAHIIRIQIAHALF